MPATDWTAERIRSARRRKGMTQRQVGELAGVAGNTVGEWERGIKRPNGESRGHLDRVLGDAVFDADVTRSLESATTLQLIMELMRRETQELGQLDSRTFRHDEPYEVELPSDRQRESHRSA